MKSRLTHLAGALLVLLVQAGCSNQPDPEERSPAGGDRSDIVTVAVTNYPLQFFAQRIGGDRVQVWFPVPADEDPAFWMPDAEAIVRFQQSDLILLNGAGYEKWLGVASLPAARQYDTSASFSDQFIQLTQKVTHTHGPEGEHEHGETAFTTWLDPQLATLHAEAVRQALTQHAPENEDLFQRNFEALKDDLAALDRDLTDVLGRLADQPFLFSHPVFHYLERRYALRARSVHWEPHEAPSESMWAELQQLLTGHTAKWMIWEGTPLEETLGGLHDMGLKSVVFDPCGGAPEEGDFLKVQRQNIANLRHLLSSQ